MGTIDLRRLDGDQIVIHFGGALTSVDAYTFANSLVSFADTVRRVNGLVNPGQKIDVRLEAVGPGSFKAVIKQVRRGIGGLFRSAPANIFWIVAALFIEDALKGESTITIGEDQIVIERDGERIILPREALDGYQNAKRDPEVRKGVARTFEALEKDEAIENFGLTSDIDDPEPLVQIPRDDFERLSQIPDVVIPEDKRRSAKKRAILVVLKPWINASKKKWAFEWNGVPISSYVKDEAFLDKVRRHEIRFGNGDAIDATIENYENYDEIGIWVSDTATYSVVKVHAFLPEGGEKVDME